ncbi:MAG: MarR family winged helix-turn-helix transcriptional regulator [Gaiellaceae bacterium]|jgi:DNA-binding MarR family transcriptional regulator
MEQFSNPNNDQIRQGGSLVSKIHQLSGRVFARKLKQHGIERINPAQGRILFVLWQEDGISIRELARRTSLGKSTLTSMLDRLELAGELERVPFAGDRRKTLIRLTEKDRAMRDTYDRVSAEMIEIYYAGFACEEIDGFERFLERILDNLEAAERPGKETNK